LLSRQPQRGPQRDGKIGAGFETSTGLKSNDAALDGITVAVTVAPPPRRQIRNRRAETRPGCAFDDQLAIGFAAVPARHAPV